MENNNLPSKKETKLQKFDKIVHNVKFINYLSIVLILSFIIVFVYVANGISEQNQNAVERQKNQQQINSLYNHNQVLLNGSGIVVSEIDTSGSQLFSNGKEAVIYAFDKLLNSSCYEMESTGTTSASAVGTSRTIQMQCESYKYSDGLQFDRNFRLDNSGITNQSAATELVYKNGTKYQRDGSLTSGGGRLDGNFETSFRVINGKVKSHPFYVINSSTVTKCNSFNIIKKDGKIEGYNVSIELDTVKSIAYYGQEIMEEGGTSFPKFYFVKMDCKIDASGNVVSYYIEEEMDASKSLPVLGNVTAHTTNKIMTVIKSTNKEPSIAKPNI